MCYYVHALFCYSLPCSQDASHHGQSRSVAATVPPPGLPSQVHHPPLNAPRRSIPPRYHLASDSASVSLSAPARCQAGCTLPLFRLKLLFPNTQDVETSHVQPLLVIHVLVLPKSWSSDCKCPPNQQDFALYQSLRGLTLIARKRPLRGA